MIIFVAEIHDVHQNEQNFLPDSPASPDLPERNATPYAEHCKKI